MTPRRTIQRIVLSVLVAGAVAFALLLAGVGSGALMNPAPYAPPTSGVITTP